jgi:hypothetical protein
MKRRVNDRYLVAFYFVSLALATTACTSIKAGFGNIQERSVQLAGDRGSGAVSLKLSVNRRIQEIDLDAVAIEALGPMPETKRSPSSNRSLSLDEMAFNWVAFDLPETVVTELRWHEGLTAMPLELEEGKTLKAKVAARVILPPKKQDQEQKPGLFLLQTMVYGVHAHPDVRWIPPFIDRVHQALLNRLEAFLVEEARKRGLKN